MAGPPLPGRSFAVSQAHPRRFARPDRRAVGLRLNHPSLEENDADTDDVPRGGTRAGVVRGRVEGGLAVFRGIPFAAPPVGSLRFQAPARAQVWGGVREAMSSATATPELPHATTRGLLSGGVRPV